MKRTTITAFLWCFILTWCVFSVQHDIGLVFFKRFMMGFTIAKKTKNTPLKKET